MVQEPQPEPADPDYEDFEIKPPYQKPTIPEPGTPEWWELARRNANEDKENSDALPYTGRGGRKK